MDIRGYFQNSKAPIGILLRLDATDGLINKELEELVTVSPTTLSKKLTQAQQEDLITEIHRPSDHGNATRYILTERGKKVKQKMQALGMDEVYEEYYQADQQLDEMEGELKDWIRDSKIDDPRWPPDRDPDDVMSR